MRKTIVVVLVLLLIVSASFSQESSDFDWVFVGKIHTPDAIWQQFVTMNEIQPIYEVGIEHVEKFLTWNQFKLPTRASMEETIYFGVGTRSGRKTPELYVWGEDQAGKVRYYQSYVTSKELLELGQSYYSGDRDEAKKLPFPAIFKDMGNENLFQMSLLQTSVLQNLRKELEKEVSASDRRLLKDCQRQVKKIEKQMRNGKITATNVPTLPACPLKGKYSLDFAKKSVTCDHHFETPKLENMSLEGTQRVAFYLLKTLENCSEFTIKLTREKPRLVLQIKYDEKAAQTKKQFPEILNSLEWFDDLNSFNRLSQQAQMHFAFCPNLRDIFRDYTPEELQKNFPKILFPEGTILVSGFGSFNPYSWQMPPLAISLNLNSEKFSQLKQWLVSMELPAQFARDELYGTELEILPSEAFFPAFNRNEQSGTSIYVYVNAQKKMEICMGKEVAIQKLAVECGEAKSVQIWEDVSAPVKLAFSVRLNSVAGGLLQLVNQAAFDNELHDCKEALSEWLSKNRELAGKLSVGSELPEGLLKCCPRNGIVIRESKFDKIMCAVHNYRSGWEIETQLFNPAIPGGRWLRAYIVKEQGQSSLIVDLKKAGVK